MPLQDGILSLDFGGGIDSKTDPKMVIPAKFQLIENGIFTNLKRITKRNGYDAYTLNQVGGSTISSPKMVQSYQDELVCVASGPSNTVSFTGNTHNSTLVDNLSSIAGLYVGQPLFGEGVSPNTNIASFVSGTSIRVDKLIVGSMTGVTFTALPKGKRLYSYSDTLSGWKDVGKYNSVQVTSKVIQENSSEQPSAEGFINSSAVTVGNLTLLSYESNVTAYGFSGSNLSYITVIDQSTGVKLVDQLSIPNSGGFTKAALLGTSTLAVFYIKYDLGTPDQLAVLPITVNLAGGVTLGTEKIIGICRSVPIADVGTTQFPYSYDYVTTSTGASVALANDTAGVATVDVYNIDTTGTTTAGPMALAATTPVKPVTIAQGSNTHLWIGWGDDDDTIFYSVLTSALVSVLVPTAADTLLENLSQITFRPLSATQMVIYYSQVLKPATVLKTFMPSIREVTVSSAGVVGTPLIFLYNADIYAKYFTLNSSNYLPVVTYSQANSTGFLVDVNDALPIAKFLQDKAEGTYSFGYTSLGVTHAAKFTGVRFPGFLNVPNTLSANQIAYGAGFVSKISILPIAGTSGLDAYPQSLIQYVALGTSLVTFDFASIEADQSLIQQETLVLNGGIVSMYDGSYVSELGFSVDPDNVALAVSTTGGNIPVGTYNYYVTYSWNDSNGNLHISAPSPAGTAVYTSGSISQTTLTIPNLFLTQKIRSVINVYRASSNLGGNLAYYVGEAFGNGQFATLADGLADTAVENNPTLYTQNGAVLENIAPPPAMAMWTNNNRLWVIDSEHAETTIDYSKTASLGSGIAFSTGQLEVVIDSKNGPIIAGQPMDEKTLILKEKGVGFFIGDGANDSGTGSSITNFQFIPSDVGCTNSKSVILYPAGVLFRTDKGIYQINRGLQITYFGFDVEAYNSQDIRSAFIVPTRNQIRFLTSSGSSLLYDYVMNQWSVFTNHAGLSACNFNGVYTYARPSGELYKENTTSFLDVSSSFTLKLKSAWINLSSVQNFERVRHLLMLGDYQNGSSASHGISIQAAYDFSSTFGSAVNYSLGAASGSGVFQYRNFFSQQKCDVISLLITEIVTGASGEYLDLTNMSLKVGLKRGLNKVTAAQSVG